MRILALTASITAVAAQCHDYVLVSIRGTYELQGQSIGFKGMINTTLLAIPNGIEYDAVYPAAANQTAYLGADDVRRYIDAGVQSCPQQKYAILGYSQGASATALTLQNYTDTSTPQYKAIKAVLVIGNPYHVPNASVNVDQNGTAVTRGYAGSLYNASDPSRNIPDVWYSSNKLIDICWAGDIVCAPAYPNSTFVPDHLKYGFDDGVQKIGSDFLIARLGPNSTTPTSNNETSPSGTSGAGSTSPTAPYTGAAASLTSPSILVAVLAAAFVLLLSGN